MYKIAYTKNRISIFKKSYLLNLYEYTLLNLHTSTWSSTELKHLGEPLSYQWTVSEAEHSANAIAGNQNLNLRFRTKMIWGQSIQQTWVVKGSTMMTAFFRFIFPQVEAGETGCCWAAMAVDWDGILMEIAIDGPVTAKGIDPPPHILPRGAETALDMDNLRSSAFPPEEW